MKLILALFALLIFANFAFAQQLPSDILEQPDGITIGYFNSLADSCHSEIFIGDSLQILFSCFTKGNYDRIDISQLTFDIKRMQELLTVELISELEECCNIKGCPDTIHGYFLMVKKGEIINYIYIDFDFTILSQCGIEQLDNLLELYLKITKKYR